MANRTQYFSDGTTVYGASDFIAPMDALTTNGIIRGYQVTAPSSGMAVNVAAGQAVLGGMLTTDDTIQSVTVPTNTGSSTRTDIIVLEINSTTMAATVKDVSGTTTPGANQILLATVAVPAGASSIVSGNIDSSERVYAGLENPFAAIAGSALMAFDGNPGGYGYVLLNNGLALQWGVSDCGAYPTYTQANFAQAFSSTPFVIVATVEDSAPASVSTAVWTASGFTIIHSDSQLRKVHWFAIGPMAVTRS